MSEPRVAKQRIALLGWGEAGGAIGRDLVSAGADVRAFDPKVAPAVGVHWRSSDAEAVADADFVLSANSGHDAIPALLEAVGAVQAGTVWADLNAASPRTKVILAETAPALSVVDVAIMAPVPGHGLHVPMVASGPEAHRFADMLNGFGGAVTVLEGPVGAASSRKLLRSVFYKGLAAAVLEALAGARAAGCEDWLRGNIAAELAGFNAQTLSRLVDGTHRHARRRTDEMAAAAEQLRDLGVLPRIADATHELLADLVAHE